MPVESAADRLAFLDTDEFGVSATYRLSGGGMSAVQGIYDAPFAEVVEDQYGAGVTVHPASFTLRAADLPGGYGDGDDLILAGTTYAVRAHELDGTGMASLRLEKL